MTEKDEVNKILDEILEKYFKDNNLRFGYFVCIGFKDEKNKKSFEMMSNLTKTGKQLIALELLRFAGIEITNIDKIEDK